MLCWLRRQRMVEIHPLLSWKSNKFSKSLSRIFRGTMLRIDRCHGSLENYLCQIRTRGTISDIINATDFRRRSALAWAIGHGWAEATAILLEFGTEGSLPVLHQALAGPVCGRLGEVFMSIIRMLLSAGADANGADWEGWTPLHIAASWNSRQSVNILSAYKIN